MASTKPTNARVSLSKSQLIEGAGAELFSLCQGMTADGKISKAEIVALGDWLTDNQDAPLPGIAYLTETLKRIVADGRVTREESSELLEAIEKVLPADARKGAKAARREVERQRKAAEKAAAADVRQREQAAELEQYRRREPVNEFDFMVAGVHVDGRAGIISRYLNIGDRVRLLPEPNNAYDACAVAVQLCNGQLIGYVPRGECEDVSDCIDDGGYYVAKVKKILTGGRLPVPVIVADFYRPDQLSDIAELEPNECGKPAANYGASPYRKPEANGPWWKIW